MRYPEDLCNVVYHFLVPNQPPFPFPCEGFLSSSTNRFSSPPIFVGIITCKCTCKEIWCTLSPPAPNHSWVQVCAFKREQHNAVQALRVGHHLTAHSGCVAHLSSLPPDDDKGTLHGRVDVRQGCSLQCWHLGYWRRSQLQSLISIQWGPKAGLVKGGALRVCCLHCGICRYVWLQFMNSDSPAARASITFLGSIHLHDHPPINP